MLLLEYTNNNSMQIENTDKSHYQEDNTKIKVKSSLIEDLIIYPIKPFYITKIDTELKRKEILAQNKSEVKTEPLPIETTLVITVIEAENGLCNIELELQNNPRKRNLREKKR